MRKIFKIPPLELSDKEVNEIFAMISEKTDELGIETFSTFFGVEENSTDIFAAAWEHIDEEKEKNRVMNAFSTKIKKRAISSHKGTDFEHVFKLFDRDGSGTLTMNEMSDAIRRFLRIPENVISRKEVMVVFRMIDTDSSGTITLSEFLTALK